ncbi:hypothetical protein COCON_G00071620 [Conger conger]|uniref:Cadherin domain-containing protein n=1 Tax=Conger conger TaxID=82655 RepID=A0A9Q1DMS9_CONCO|nr:hypothetical protein COCON_G00071620 [Conger conger]
MVCGMTLQRPERYVSLLFVFCRLWSGALSVTRYSIPEEMEQGSVVANLATDLGFDVRDLSLRDSFYSIPVMENNTPGSLLSSITAFDPDLHENQYLVYFIGSVVEEAIPRSTDKGHLVAKVIAIDADSVQNSRITYQFLQVPDATLFSLDQYNGEIRTVRMFSYRDPRHLRLVVVAKDNGDPALSATVTIKLSTVEHVIKTLSETTELPLDQDIFSDLNLYLVMGLGSVSFLLLITILVIIVLKCQKAQPARPTPPCRNSVSSQRSSTTADSTLVSSDAYWYSLFLAQTRKGKVVVRQPVPKGPGYMVSSLPRGTALTETSQSRASTLQYSK